MKGVICNEFNNWESILFTDFEPPVLGEKQVLIKVAAVGLNYPDKLIIERKYQFLPDLPFVPGGEFSGVILRVGSEVKGLYVGQRVFGIERWGALSETLVLDQDRVFALDNAVDLVSGCSLLYNASTALYALKNIGGLVPGQTLLILGGSSGVGLAANQLAKAMDVEVLAQGSTADKLELCKNLGADRIINTSETNLRDQVKSITSGKGVNIVLDCIGGKWAVDALKCLKTGGKYLAVGFASGEIPQLPLNLVLLKEAQVKGVFWGKFSREYPLKQQSNLEAIFDYFRAGKLKPYVQAQYPIEDFKTAFKALEEREQAGKIVVVVSSDLLNKDQQIKAPKPLHQPFVFLSKDHLMRCGGERLGVSRWHQITQEDINIFGSVTQDTQWIHTWPEKAAKTPAEGSIVHGFFTLAMVPKLLSEVYQMDFVKMGLNYGLDKVRFTAPVKANQRICLEAVLKSAETFRNDGVKCRLAFKIFAEGNNKPVCTGELHSLVF